MNKVKIRKPKPDTIHWAFGINVFNKNEFEVPENLVSSFVTELGYEVVKEESEEGISCKYCGEKFESKRKLLAHYKVCEEK